MTSDKNINPLCRVSVAVLIASSAFHASAIDIHWANAVNGDWNDSKNWAEGFIPNSNDNAELGLFGEYFVSISLNTSIVSLSIPNPDATLDIVQGRKLELFGSLHNAGQVRVDPLQGKLHTELLFRLDQTISGTGKLTLSSSDAVLRVQDNRVITQDAPHEIHGIGTIEGEILNRGLIHADAPGILDVYESDIDQEDEGLIRSTGEDSVLQLTRSYIDGGRVETVDGGRLRIASYGGLNDVTISDSFTIELEGSGYIENSQLVDVDLTYRSDIGANLYLGVENELLGTGSMFLDPGHPNGGFELESGFVIPDTYTIRGHGRLLGFITNESLILADQPGKVLQVSSLRNTGLLAAENGGTLEVLSSVDNWDAKMYASGEESRILFDNFNVFLNGGTLQTLDGAKVENNGGLLIENTLLLCEIQSNPDSLITLTGLIYHDQPIVLNNATLKLENHAILYGPGTVYMQGEDAALTGDGYSYSDLTNGVDHRIEGAGGIGSRSTTLINGGVISANRAGESLNIGFTLENHGLLEAVQGGILSLNGIVNQAEEALIRSDGPTSTVVLGTINGGEIRSENGGLFTLSSNQTLAELLINADIAFDDFHILKLDGSCELNGLIDTTTSGAAGGIVEVLNPYALQGTGTIRLGTPTYSTRIMGGQSSDPIVIDPGFRVEGEGYLWGFFECHGTLAPGLGIGTLFSRQDLVLSDQSVLEIQIAPDSSDLLDCEAQTTMSGSIEVGFIDGFAPAASWGREVVRADDLHTPAITLDMPPPPAGLVSRYHNDGTTLRIGQSFVADMTLDGELNFYDVSAFLDAYADGSLLADLNNDQATNFFDVTTFVQAYLATP
ncbi:MAG: hypothetical protein ACF8MF_04485 [Phycisphaerales bacterium JB052]